MPPPCQATIREERSDDLPAVRTVNDAAFGGPAEAELVGRLYAENDVLFGLVAEAGGQVVGHILFSKLPIHLNTGWVAHATALAPLAVLPPCQRTGVGGALVREGLARCRALGVAAVVVLGDPAYYTRFGFQVELARGLRSPWSGPHLMAIELMPGALGDGAGEPRYAAAFG